MGFIKGFYSRTAKDPRAKINYSFVRRSSLSELPGQQPAPGSLSLFIFACLSMDYSRVLPALRIHDEPKNLRSWDCTFGCTEPSGFIIIPIISCVCTLHTT